jgi:hypothetical protein
MSNIKRTLHEPAIQKLLTGVVRCGTTSGNRYYRLSENGFVRVAAFVELMKLGMSAVTATCLLREALSSGLITVEQIGPAQVIAAPSDEKASANVESGDSEEEEKDEDPLEENGTHYSKSPLGLSDIPKGDIDRYELVKSGDFFGYFDRQTYRQILISKEKTEVMDLIFALRRNPNVHCAL